MRKFTTSLLFLAAAVAAAEPGLLRLAPSDTGIVIGINVDQIRASKLGGKIFSDLSSGSPEFARFVKATGFDPLRDVTSVLIAMPGRNQKGRGLFFVEGRFDPERLIRAANTPGVAVTTVGGIRVITKQQDQPLSIACVSPALLVAGDPESVRGVLARRMKPAGGPDASLAAKAAKLNTNQHIWVVARISPAELAPEMPSPQLQTGAGAEMLKSIQQFSGGITFGPKMTVSFDLLTRNEQDAQAMASAIKLMAGLAVSQTGGQSAAAAALVDQLDLRAEGAMVKLALAVPEEEIEKGLATRMAAQKAGGVAVRSSPAQSNHGGVTVFSSPKDMGVVRIP